MQRHRETRSSAEYRLVQRSQQGEVGYAERRHHNEEDRDEGSRFDATHPKEPTRRLWRIHL